jgi:glycosyltransferase
VTQVSVITATRNCADTIGDCLASVAGQSHGAREHIVVDGASTDGTVAALERHRRALSYFVSEPDTGIYDALNKGVAQARGDVMGFLHADDVYADNGTLARIAAAFSDPRVDAVFGDLVYVTRDHTARVVRYWRAGEYDSKQLKFGWMPPHPTLYVRRRVYQEIGSFNTTFRIAADYDFMLRLLKSMRGRAVYIPEVLVRMRVGGASNRSIGSILKKSAEDYRALKANGVGGAGALALKNLSKISQFLKRPRGAPADSRAAAD